MMELSFEYYNFLKILNDSPEIMVFSAGFGTPIIMLLFSPIARLYRSLSLSEILNVIIYGGLVILWIGGFIIMMSLMFAGVSGIKLFLIWLMFAIVVFTFMISNKKEILKIYVTEYKKKTFPKVRK